MHTPYTMTFCSSSNNLFSNEISPFLILSFLFLVKIPPVVTIGPVRLYIRPDVTSFEKQPTWQPTIRQALLQCLKRMRHDAR